MSSPNSDEIGKRSRVDNRRESYQGFFDCDWNNDLEETTRGLPALARVFFDLAMSWREASNIQYMPSHSVHLLEVFATGQDSYGEEFKTTLLDRLSEKLGSNWSHTKRKETLKAVGEVIDELNSLVTHPDVAFNGDRFWPEFVANQEIRFTLRGSQRMCFASIYFAYENFLLQVYKLISGSPEYSKGRAKEFGNDLASVFDKSLVDYCWSDSAIQIAGLVRDSLVHVGGRETDKLKKRTHGYEVVDGELQILPRDTKALHNLLQARVTRVVTEAAAILRNNASASSS